MRATCLIATVLLAFLATPILQAQSCSAEFKLAGGTVEMSDTSTSFPLQVRISKCKGRSKSIPYTLNFTMRPVASPAPRSASRAVRLVKFSVPRGGISGIFKEDKSRTITVTIPKKAVRGLLDGTFDITGTIASGGSSTAFKNTFRVNFIKSLKGTLYLNEYESDALAEYRIEEITSVEQTDNLVTVTGHLDNARLRTVTRNLYLLERERYVEVRHRTPRDLWKSGGNHLRVGRRLEYSIATVPIKIRPFREQKATAGDSTQTFRNFAVAQTGLNNVGVNVGFLYWNWKKYKYHGGQSSSRLSVGTWIAPTVQTLTPENTIPKLSEGESLPRLFLSTALTVSYTRSGVNFILVPIGCDWIPGGGRSSQWVYNGTRWHGVGIGISTTLLSTFLK